MKNVHMVLKTSCFLTGPGDEGPNFNVIGNITIEKITAREFTFLVKKFVRETTIDSPNNEVSLKEPITRILRLEGEKE